MPFSFTEEDYEDVKLPHEDPLVINPIVGENKIWKVMVDGGRSTNILSHRTYTKMNLARQQMEPCREAPLEAFGGHHIPCEGTITLPVLIGKMPYTTGKQVKFYIVRVESQYNALLSRPFLSAFQAVDSIPHLKLKFPTENGVGERRGYQKITRIIMLEGLDRDKEYEENDSNGKRKRSEAKPSGNK
ncbi:uncharacterized protein LOC141659950 [Apium graveolens]|uniref:uncharacterized protein LOC141659950 n=1 Tax=Apium graveolens TaxID=4045 RepID=UPI003D799256